MTDSAESLLSLAVESLALSGRAFDRAVKVARTIADLGGSDRVDAEHMSEALGYRALGRRDDVAEAG